MFLALESDQKRRVKANRDVIVGRNGSAWWGIMVIWRGEVGRSETRRRLTRQRVEFGCRLGRWGVGVERDEMGRGAGRRQGIVKCDEADTRVLRSGQVRQQEPFL